MSRQTSQTELSAKLAASLTPRLQYMPAPARGEQSSGLVDVGAMYAASVEQMMRRAERVQRPVVRVGTGRAALPGHQPARGTVTQRPVAGSRRAGEYEEVDLAGEYALPGTGRRGPIGWFAVAVAWAATTTLAAAISTMVPAHGLKGEIAKPPAPPAAAIPALSPTPSLAPAPASTTPSLDLATGIITPAPVSPASPATAPHTSAAISPAAAAPTPPSTSAAAIPPPPAAIAKAKPISHPRVSHPDAPSAAAAPAPSPSPSPAAKAAASSPAPAAVPAAPASLEDLIRAAVEKESKKH